MSFWHPALLTAALLSGLAGCAVPPTTDPRFGPEAAPMAQACPAGVPAGTRCLGGRDSAGAHVLIAVPADWNGVLVLHAHGGPLLGAPRADRVAEDLSRWAVVVRAGYAWAASSYAQGGVAVRAAATDTERLRRLFVQHVAPPQRTVLHGQSWGASVAAQGAEMFSTGRPYDAVLLSSGVLGGGSRSYDFRLDLRVIYQALCHNHPRPDEPAYPLWRGLPDGSRLTPGELAGRARACLGLGLPVAQRTPEQARKLRTLLGTLHLEERSLLGHLNWATFHFRDIAQRSGDRPVFGNAGARYQGSDDDEVLNAQVLRYRADPQALRRFADDTDPRGAIPVPVLSVHAVHDPVAFVELEHRFRETMQAAGRGDALVQVYTNDHEHSYLSDPLYPALLAALLDWQAGGPRPTPQDLARRCAAEAARHGPGCRLLPDYEPAPLDQRVTPRERP